KRAEVARARRRWMREQGLFERCAAVRLYVNDSYHESTTAAADGHLAFSVDKGVDPGSYRVRLVEVESRSGAVQSRAEVGFIVPATVPVDEVARSSHGQGVSQSNLQNCETAGVGLCI